MKWTNEIIEKAIRFVNEGKSYDEISDILNCSKKSLGNILHRNNIKKIFLKKHINCLLCNTEIEVRINDPRIFCSTSCAAKYNNPGRIQTEETRLKIAKSLALNDDYIYTKKEKAEFCLNCSKKLDTQSKYCNNKCSSEKRSVEKLNDWLNGKIPGHFNNESYGLLTIVRKWVFARANNKCEECGCDKKNSYTGKSILQIDHIDGDASNSKPNNLKVLCPTCHAMTPTYGYIGKRVSKRYQYRKNYRDKNK